jgi:hypothetical protein
MTAGTCPAVRLLTNKHVEKKNMSNNPNNNAPLRIVVLPRSFVLIGRVRVISDTELEISDCATIRRWGTTGHGLGYLGSHGRQTDTVLDNQPVTFVHPYAVVQQISCDETVWPHGVHAQTEAFRP